MDVAECGVSLSLSLSRSRGFMWTSLVLLSVVVVVFPRRPGPHEQRRIAGTCISRESGRTVQGKPAAAVLWK